MEGMNWKRGRTTRSSTPGSFAAHERSGAEVELGGAVRPALEEVISRCGPDLELLAAYDRGTFSKALAERYLVEGDAKPLPEGMLALLVIVAEMADHEEKEKIIGVLRGVVRGGR